MTVCPIKPGIGFNSIPKGEAKTPADLRAELKAAEALALQDALQTLVEGARRATDCAAQTTTPPGVSDRLKRLAAHVEAEVASINSIAERNG